MDCVSEAAELSAHRCSAGIRASRDMQQMHACPPRTAVSTLRTAASAIPMPQDSRRLWSASTVALDRRVHGDACGAENMLGNLLKGLRTAECDKRVIRKLGQRDRVPQIRKAMSRPGTAMQISSSNSTSAPAGTSSRETAQSSSRSLPSGVLPMRKSAIAVLGRESRARISLSRSDAGQCADAQTAGRGAGSPRSRRRASQLRIPESSRAYRSRISPCSVRLQSFSRSFEQLRTQLALQIPYRLGYCRLRHAEALVRRASYFRSLATAANCRSWYNFHCIFLPFYHTDRIIYTYDHSNSASADHHHVCF